MLNAYGVEHCQTPKMSVLILDSWRTSDPPGFSYMLASRSCNISGIGKTSVMSNGGELIPEVRGRQSLSSMVSVMLTFSPCTSTACVRKCGTSKCSILLGCYTSSCTRKIEDIAVSPYQPGHYHGRLSLQFCKPIFPGGHLSFFSSVVCRAKQGDSALGGENNILDQQILEQELQVAIKEENYAKAAKIRDMLRSIQEDSKASVLAANAEFYRSFKNGDLSAMQAIWTKGDHVCCVHPGVLGISGYESVMDSWIHVWGNYEFPLEIELREVRVHVRGDLGYVTCVELVKTKGSSWGGQFVTNVFERGDGQWFICVHHASPVDF